MALVLRAAALGLLALSSAQSARGETVTGVSAPDSLYEAINLARAGGLATALIQVKISADLINVVIPEVVAKAGNSGTTCPNVGSVTPSTAEGFVLTFNHETENPDYKTLVQNALDVGLQELSTYPTQGWGEGIWKTSEKAKNIGYLLWSSSAEAGCGVTKGCTDNSNLVICRFKPTVQNGVAPFDEQFYHALKARTKKIQEMSSNDFQSPGNGGTMGAPSMVVAGLVAALMMVTV
ncbi:hypothetical protein Efla_000050 [Eimeria flavescens]